MQLATLKLGTFERAAILASHGYVPLERLRRSIGEPWPGTMMDLLTTGLWEELRTWSRTEDGIRSIAETPAVSREEAVFAPPYRNPEKIWGIGLNYVKQGANPEREGPLDEPVGFMKPATTLIGPGDDIMLPEDCGEVTAEAELAIVIGKRCRHVSEAEAPSVVAGFTTALDMTAADIHGRNPRYLTRAKSYDTFFSFGPHLVSVDEIDDVLDLNVVTVLNGQEMFRNRIFNMKYRPWYTVAFHSRFMTLMPGDILLTGTPGPVAIRVGDRVECRVNDFRSLINPVAG